MFYAPNTDKKGLPVAVYEYARNSRFEPSRGHIVSGTRTLQFLNAAQRDSILRDFEAAYTSVPGHYRIK